VKSLMAGALPAAIAAPVAWRDRHPGRGVGLGASLISRPGAFPIDRDSGGAIFWPPETGVFQFMEAVLF